MKTADRRHIEKVSTQRRLEAEYEAPEIHADHGQSPCRVDLRTPQDEQCCRGRSTEVCFGYDQTLRFDR
jgi:hypothetical protein